MKVPFSKRFWIDHLLFSEMETDSSSAMLERIARNSSLSIEPVFMFSFLKKMGICRASSILTSSKQSVVFLLNRLIDFVMIKSTLPALQSSMSRSSSGRLPFLVPVIPSS